MGWGITLVALAVGIAVAQGQAPLQAKAGSGATVVVSCDRACIWTLDGEPMGSLGEGVSKEVAVSMGQHQLHAEAQEGMYVDDKKIDVDSASQSEMQFHLKAAAAVETGSCVEIAEVSAKVPALPAGSPCAKHLYTVSDENLEYVSPLEGPDLRSTLRLKSTPDAYSLDYIDTQVGTGRLATAHKWITVHYTGYLVDGTKFDSSLDHEPMTFRYAEHQVIAGWDTGFAGMRVGGRRRLFIPSQLAYGARQMGPVPANAELIFDVELIGESDEAPAPRMPTAPPPSY